MRSRETATSGHKQGSPTAAILLIGDELLLDPKMDLNGPFLSQRLLQLGIRTREIRVLPDRSFEIEEAVLSLRSRHTYVFAIGGLGPTHDDVTAAAVAAAFGVPREPNPAAIAMLQSFHLSENVPASRMPTARIPKGAEVIDDPISGSPGFYIENVFVMAGSPEVLQCMFRSITHLLGRGPPLHSRSVKIVALESEVAGDLAIAQREFPDVEIGSYPYFPQDSPAVNVVIRSRDLNLLQACMHLLRARLAHLGSRVLG